MDPISAFVRNFNHNYPSQFKTLVIKDSKNTSRTDCGIHTENNILYNNSTMGKDTNVPFLCRFSFFSPF